MTWGLPTHGDGESNALDVVAGDPGETLEDAHQVRATISTSHGMHLVDDHGGQLSEERMLVHALTGGHKELGRFLENLAALIIKGIAVPDEEPEIHHLGLEAEALGLVVQEGFDRGDIEGSHPRGFAKSRAWAEAAAGAQGAPGAWADRVNLEH
jgi:hypothetical protein